MRRVFIGLCISLFCSVLAACKRSEPPTATPPTPDVAMAEPQYPTHAQPTLPKMKLLIGNTEINAEIASTAIQEQTGMMFRTNQSPDSGMLFILPHPEQTGFWMKNTLLPLSAAYINPEGVIEEIHDLKPLDTSTVLAEHNDILFVLETPQGWFKERNIAVGVAITTEKGPLKKVFFGAGQ